MVSRGIGKGIAVALAFVLGSSSAVHAQPLPADQLCTDVDLTEFIPRATHRLSVDDRVVMPHPGRCSARWLLRDSAI